MKKTLQIAVLFLLLVKLSPVAFGQNYTSIGSGSWTTTTNWQNTSGWGSAAPPVSGQGSGTISVAHNITLTGNYALGSAILNINAGRTLTITGNLTQGGGSTINVSGTLIVSGDVALNSTFNILPGGKVVVDGSLTVISANYLNVGTSVAPPPYADLVIKQDLISLSSGDVTINRNGRVAIFGDVVANGGGTFLTVNNGGQVYIEGDVTFTGGGSTINNNNTTSPYGLYINSSSTVTNSGGGSTTTTNKGDENTMQTTNPDFYNWVTSQGNIHLPVTVLFFIVQEIGAESITLSWATAAELNFDKFIIERTLDGKDFVEIGRVNGAGVSSTRHDYTFEDRYPLIGRAYYRLKAVDIDGYVEYFGIVRTDYEGNKDISVYPNPTTGSNIGLSLNFTPDENAVIIIIDLLGVEITRKTFSKTDQLFTFDSPLTSGTYIIRVITGNSSFTKQFIVI